MKPPVAPITACCAVGPDGRLDIDLIRRNQASAQHAAKSIQGGSWPALASKGWRIIAVEIRDQSLPEAVEQAPVSRDSPPVRRGLDVVDRMSAADYRREFGGGAGALVRCADSSRRRS